jgi:hypothetical protein
MLVIKGAARCRSYSKWHTIPIICEMDASDGASTISRMTSTNRARTSQGLAQLGSIPSSFHAQSVRRLFQCCVELGKEVECHQHFLRFGAKVKTTQKWRLESTRFSLRSFRWAYSFRATDEWLDAQSRQEVACFSHFVGFVTSMSRMGAAAGASPKVAKCLVA